MAKSWRDVLKVHPAADLFPMMTPDELKALGEDTKKNGLQVPITLSRDRHANRDDQLLDGRNRLDAMEAVGISVLAPLDDPYYSGSLDKSGVLRNLVFWQYEDSTDPYEYVLSANVHRRHLTGEQKRELIAKVLKAQPEQSNRRIAEQTKVDDKTVGTVRRELEARAEIPHVEKRQDSKGRQQPAQKPPDRAESREVRQQAKAERRAERECELAQRITALPTKQYGVILADPPWRFEPWSRDTGMDRAADNHYPTMTTEEVKALEVAAIAAPDSVLWLWATVPMLPQALEVMKAWGFGYRSHIVWDKQAAGTGYWFRNRHEVLLLGVRGEVPCPAGGQSESILAAPVRKHSEKPGRAIDVIEKYFPTLPKIELFRRGPPRPGWDAWGNEVEAPEHAEDPLAIPGFLRRDRTGALPAGA